MHDPSSWFRKTWFTRRRVREFKNAHNSVTVQNRTHVCMNFFHHKDLGNHLLQLCPKVVKHPVYVSYYLRVSASNRKEYQEYFLGCRGGLSVGLITLPPSCADCLEIWEPEPPGTSRACKGVTLLYTGCFTILGHNCRRLFPTSL